MSVELSIVIPAYMEEENLRLLLPRLRKTVETVVDSFEILIVDTLQPRDSTREVCDESGVIYRNRKGSDSFGDAVRTGISQSKGRHVLFMDADGSHPPEFIPRLLEFKEAFDVVIASRYIGGGHTENKQVLIWMSRVLNLTYAVVLNIHCRDVSNSFKIYKGDDLRAIQLHCDNFDIVEEILVKLSRRRTLRIKEVPFTFKKRMFGESKRSLVLFVFSYLFTLLRLRFGR